MSIKYILNKSFESKKKINIMRMRMRIMRMMININPNIQQKYIDISIAFNVFVTRMLITLASLKMISHRVRTSLGE